MIGDAGDSMFTFVDHACKRVALVLIKLRMGTSQNKVTVDSEDNEKENQEECVGKTRNVRVRKHIETKFPDIFYYLEVMSKEIGLCYSELSFVSSYVTMSPARKTLGDEQTVVEALQLSAALVFVPFQCPYPI